MWSLMPWKKTPHSEGAMTTDFEREFSRIREDFQSLVERMWNQDFLSDRWFDGRFGMGFEETDTHYVARLEVPGFEVDDFDVSVQGNHLVVKAEHQESQGGKNGSVRHQKRFHRAMALPESADTEQISADYHSGVLELTIPKGKERQNRKRIAVKSA